MYLNPTHRVANKLVSLSRMKQQATGVPDYLCLSVHEINIAFRIDECPIYAL